MTFLATDATPDRIRGTHRRPPYGFGLRVRSRLGAAVAAVVVVTLAATGCGTSSNAPAASSALHVPDTILIREPGLYPESVEWDGERGRFLVSSAAAGSITAVADDGSTSVLDPGDDIASTLGTDIDPERNRLLATAADFSAVQNPQVAGEAKLAAYVLSTGTRLRLVDLAALRPGSRHLANDVTIDRDGNAYVTDSFSPVVYKVTPDGRASILVEHARLASAQGLGLNGIAYHPDGYLLAAVAGIEKLYRIPLDAPADLAEVALPQPLSIDGIAMQPDGSVVVAAPFTPAVFRLSSQDGWRSARIDARTDVAATDSTTNTATRDNALYALNLHFAQMGGAEPVPSFEIFRVLAP